MADTEEFKVSLIADARDVEAKIVKTRAKLKDFTQKASQDAQVRVRLNIANLERDLRLARAELRKFQKEGDKAGEIRTSLRIQGLKDSVNQSNKFLRGLQKEADTTKKSFFSLNGIVRDGIKAFAGYFGIRTVINFFSGLNREAIEFEKTLANVSTLIQGDSTDSIKNFRKEIIELSKVIPKDVNDLGGGLYQVLSAGITDSAEALNVLEVSAKAAVAGLTDTNTAVDAITTILNAYNLSTDQAGKVSDIFFTTIREGKTTFPELAASVGTVASSAALAGVSFDQLGAAFATLTKAGISTEEAATALNRIILNLVNPTEGLKNKAKSLGIELGANAVRTKGFVGVLSELAELTEENQDALFALGLEQRAFKAASILAGTGAEEFAVQLTKTENALGAAEEAFGKANNTFESRSKVFRQQVSAVYLKFAETVLPALTKALDFLVRDGGKNLDKILTVIKNLGKVLIVVFSVKTISNWVNSLRTSATRAVNSLNSINRAASSIPRQIAINVALIGATTVLAGLELISNKLDDIAERRAQIQENANLESQKNLKIFRDLKNDESDQLRAISSLSEEKSRVLSNIAKFESQTLGILGRSKINQEEVNRLKEQDAAITKDINERVASLSSEEKARYENSKDGFNLALKRRKNIKDETDKLNNQNDVIGNIGGSAKKSEDSIKDMQEAVDDFNKELSDTNKRSEKLRDDLTDFFKDIEDSINDARKAQEKLTDSFAGDIAERALDIDEEEAKLIEDRISAQEKLNELKEDETKIQSEGEVDLEKLKDVRDSIIKQQNEIKKINEDINKLIEERGQIEIIAAGGEGIQESIDDLKRRAGLTETQRLEEDFRKSKEIEQRKIDLQNEFLELQSRTDREAIVAKRKLEQIAKGERIADEEEINKILEEAGIENLDREEQQLFISQQQKASALATERQQVEQQLNELLAAKEEHFRIVEELQAKSTDNMIEKTNELINQIKQAQIEQIKLNELRSARNSSGAVTNNTTTNLNVNNNISGNVDLEAANRQLINKINQ